MCGQSDEDVSFHVGQFISVVVLFIERKKWIRGSGSKPFLENDRGQVEASAHPGLIIISPFHTSMTHCDNPHSGNTLNPRTVSGHINLVFICEMNVLQWEEEEGLFHVDQPPSAVLITALFGFWQTADEIDLEVRVGPFYTVNKRGGNCFVLSDRWNHESPSGQHDLASCVLGQPVPAQTFKMI